MYCFLLTWRSKLDSDTCYFRLSWLYLQFDQATSRWLYRLESLNLNRDDLPCLDPNSARSHRIFPIILKVNLCQNWIKFIDFLHFLFLICDTYSIVNLLLGMSCSLFTFSYSLLGSISAAKSLKLIKPSFFLSNLLKTFLRSLSRVKIP